MPDDETAALLLILRQQGRIFFTGEAVQFAGLDQSARDNPERKPKYHSCLTGLIKL